MARYGSTLSGMNDDEPAIDSGGGYVRLRLDIAYDGTDFAGWAVQAGQRTVAGALDDALSTVFRSQVQLRAAGRTDAGVHATGQVAHVDVPADALSHAYPRRLREADAGPSRRRSGSGVPAAGAPARAVSARRCAGARHRPRRTGFRCPVLGVAPPLRLSTVHRPIRGRAAAGALCDRVAATTGRRRDVCRGAGSGGAARLRRVLPPTRRRHHHPRSAAAGLGARRRLRHRVCHRRRVLLVDGAVTGRCAAGGGGAPSRTRLVRNVVDVDAALQRFRGGATAGADARRRGLSARRPTQARTKVTRDLRVVD